MEVRGDLEREVGRGNTSEGSSEPLSEPLMVYDCDFSSEIFPDFLLEH